MFPYTVEWVLEAYETSFAFPAFFLNVLFYDVYLLFSSLIKHVLSGLPQLLESVVYHAQETHLV